MSGQKGGCKGDECAHSVQSSAEKCFHRKGNQQGLHEDAGKERAHGKVIAERKTTAKVCRKDEKAVGGKVHTTRTEMIYFHREKGGHRR